METLVDVLGMIALLVLVVIYLYFREFLQRWTTFWEKGEGWSAFMPKWIETIWKTVAFWEKKEKK